MKSLKSRLRALFSIGNYYTWDKVPTDGKFSITQLIYPLRYDVLVRKSFFDLYKTHQELYRSNLPAFIKLTKQHPYYIWFVEVAIAKAKPEIRADQSKIDKAFIKRVHRSISLYENMKASGFDRSKPIILQAGDTVITPKSGVKTDHEVYPADGCHRLACLVSFGYTQLPADYIRLRRYKKLQPLDNTSLLAVHNTVDINWPREYLN